MTKERNLTSHAHIHGNVNKLIIMGKVSGDVTIEADSIPLDSGEHKGELICVSGGENVIAPRYIPVRVVGDPDVPEVTAIAINRLKEYSNRQPNVIPDFKFIRIKMVEDETLFSPMREGWNVGNKLSSIHMPGDFNFRDEGFELYRVAQYGFHMNTRERKDLRSQDPILDVSMLNQSTSAAMITGLKVACLAAWSIPKAIPVPYILRPFQTYKISIHFEHKYCGVEFYDPIVIPSEGAWRFKLHLESFCGSLRRFGNESLVSVRVDVNGEYIESAPIYLGILS